MNKSSPIKASTLLLQSTFTLLFLMLTVLLYSLVYANTKRVKLRAVLTKVNAACIYELHYKHQEEVLQTAMSRLT